MKTDRSQYEGDISRLLQNSHYIDDFKVLARHYHKKNKLTNCSIGEDSVVIDFETKKGEGNTIVITGFKESPMPLAKCGVLITHYSDKYLNNVNCGPAKIYLVMDESSYKNAWSYICAVLEYPDQLYFSPITD
jgi:hypothetical protein|tara:strand:- start:242 stop:640 length:399 start_codon:yes stop_codon:yes gene_type:complete